MKKIQLLIPGHPQWVNFCNKIMQMKDCDHSLDFTIECLNHYPGVDIERTVTWFTKHGGHCACEVIFNVSCPGFDEEGNFVGKTYPWEIEVGQ